MEQLKLPIETSKDKAVTEFISRPFKGSLIKVYLISGAESIRRRKSGIEGGSDEYCFCKCVGITVDYNRDEPREIALVKRLHSDFTTYDANYFLQKQKVRFLR